MSLFSKILDEKLKKEDLYYEDSMIAASGSRTETILHSGLGMDLLRWLNSAPLSQKSYYKVEDSSYSIYKKDSETIQATRAKREEIELNLFINQLPSEKIREAVRFFYAQGARSFMSFSTADLKRDYKRLALKLHPDKHFNEIPSVQKRFHEDFRVLSESYDTLKMHFTTAKQG